MSDANRTTAGPSGNVLLITADQWRWDYCTNNGFSGELTPAVNRLAAEATSFNRHFANSTPCGPSRACLLTGMYAHNHRSILNGTPLDSSFTNVALEARKAGYSPELFGYTDTSGDPRILPENDPVLTTYEGVLPGFDPVCLLIENNRPWLSYLKDKGYDVPGPGYAICQPLIDDDPMAPTRQPARYRAEHSDTAWLVDQCIDHLGRLKSEARGTPFFVHLSLLRPHPPWIASPPYHELFDPSDMPPANRQGNRVDEAIQHPYLDWQLARIGQGSYFAGGQGLASDLNAQAVAHIRATYAGLVREVDDNLGRLFNALKQLGYYDDTMIAVTSDHGEQLGDHYLFGKLGYFDESYRIPLIIRDPSNPAGQGTTIDGFTESVDVMPTLLNWMGMPAPEQCDGRSLAPWLNGDSPEDWRNAVHWSFDFRHPVTQEAERHFGLASDACGASVRREQNWKYVHFAGLPPLLFDLAADPDEMTDLSTDPGHQTVRLQQAEAMMSWRHKSSYGALSNTMLTDKGPFTQPNHANYAVPNNQSAAKQ